MPIGLKLSHFCQRPAPHHHHHDHSLSEWAPGANPSLTASEQGPPALTPRIRTGNGGPDGRRGSGLALHAAHLANEQWALPTH